MRAKQTFASPDPRTRFGRIAFAIGNHSLIHVAEFIHNLLNRNWDDESTFTNPTKQSPVNSLPTQDRSQNIRETY